MDATLRVAIFDDVVAARRETFHIRGLEVDVYGHADDAEERPIHDIEGGAGKLHPVGFELRGHGSAKGGEVEAGIRPQGRHFGRRKEGAQRPLGRMGHQAQLTRCVHRELREEQRVDGPENHGVGPDAEAQRERGDQGQDKARCVGPKPGAMQQVGAE